MFGYITSHSGLNIALFSISIYITRLIQHPCTLSTSPLGQAHDKANYKISSFRLQYLSHWVGNVRGGIEGNNSDKIKCKNIPDRVANVRNG